VTVEAAIDNADNGLRSGMFVTARITQPGGGQSVLSRRKQCSPTEHEFVRVFVIQDNAAHLRVVQTGEDENNMTQIITGVKADENCDRQLGQLYEGAKVQVQ
jgi:multidrug efflux pump subunit AcrA (membrane-fusion protein)